MLRLLPSSEGDVGNETSQNTGTSHCTPGAVQNTRVGLVQAALLDHLILNNEYEHSRQLEEMVDRNREEKATQYSPDSGREV